MGCTPGPYGPFATQAIAPRSSSGGDGEGEGPNYLRTLHTVSVAPAGRTAGTPHHTDGPIRNTMPLPTDPTPPAPPDPAPDAPRPSPPGPTVGDLVAGYLAHTGILVRAGLAAAATLRWYRAQFAHLGRAGLLPMPAAALRTHHLAPIRLTNAFARAARRLTRWAVAEELLARDPFAKLAVPACGRRERTLTRPDLVKLLRACPRPLRLLLLVQLRTIARPGEIRNLTWDQLDLPARLIVLRKFKGQRARRDGARARPIALDAWVCRMLARLRAKAADPVCGRVFVATAGRPWTDNGFRCAVRRARDQAALGGAERVVAYHLRHTGATEAIRAGVSLKLLASMMGHTRTVTTERYTHMNAEDLVGGIDQMDRRRKRPA